MCGIIGYVGKNEAMPILLQGLRKLEYRGYDSAGIVIQNNNTLTRIRATGKIKNLTKKTETEKIPGTIGIGHTRWATHGSVTEANSHPHTNQDNKLMIVHNGIIENYREIKEKLGPEYKYQSETDTEILANLIDLHLKKIEQTQNIEDKQKNLRLAITQALKHVRGTYGLVIIHQDIPNFLITARKGSPLIIGVGNEENYIASDATPLLPHTKKVIYLEDEEIAEVTSNQIKTYNLTDKIVEKCTEEITWNDKQAQKQGYEHFMLKEIHDQPTALKDAIRGRYNLTEGTAHLGGLNMTLSEMQNINKIIIIACGTAYIAGTAAKYAFEKLTGISTEVDYSSEFRYRNPIIDKQTLVFAISQSGETADTLAAIREAKRKGAHVRGIVNVIGSTIARETDGGTYIHAGPEISVASSKAYTNMYTVLLLYAIKFGRIKKISPTTLKDKSLHPVSNLIPLDIYKNHNTFLA